MTHCLRSRLTFGGQRSEWPTARPELSPPLKQSVHIHLSFCADIYMPVHDGGYVEPESTAGTVASGILIAVVELMADVRGIACRQSASPVPRIPPLVHEHPHHTPFI